MTTLLTRMRPLTLQAARIRLPHRSRRPMLQPSPALPATEERLATAAEVDDLRSICDPRRP